MTSIAAMSRHSNRRPESRAAADPVRPYQHLRQRLPQAASGPADAVTDNVVTDQSVDSEMHPPSQPYAVDDDQPYPIYGWLTLAWRQYLHAKRLPRPAAEEAAAALARSQ